MLSRADLIRAADEIIAQSEEETQEQLDRIFRPSTRSDQLRMAEQRLTEAKVKVDELWRQKRVGAITSKPAGVTWGDFTLQKLSVRHLQIIHLRLLGWRQSEICKRFGISKSRMSVILTSSLVRAEMKRRRYLAELST